MSARGRAAFDQPRVHVQARRSGRPLGGGDAAVHCRAPDAVHHARDLDTASPALGIVFWDAEHGVGWDGVCGMGIGIGWYGMVWDVTGWDGMKMTVPSSSVTDGMGWDRTLPRLLAGCCAG